MRRTLLPKLPMIKINILIAALIAVESAGNDAAVGDNGMAVGCLQIWETTVEDINRFAGTSYTAADRRDRKKSIEMCKLYLTHYGTEKRLGRTPTVEELARIWNGGPNGYKRDITLQYWKKVKSKLEK